MKQFCKYAAIVAVSVEAIKENRVRTFLSLIGILIGISSVVLVMSINDSGRDTIFKELETFGLKSVWISRDSGKFYDDNSRYVQGTGIFNEDYAVLVGSCCPSLKRLSPIITLSAGQSVSFLGRVMRSSVTGVNEMFAEINNEQLSSGRFLQFEDVRTGSLVVVVSEAIASTVSGASGRDALGDKIRVGESWYTIVGVLSNKSRDFISSIGAGKSNSNMRMLIPYTTAQRVRGDLRSISYLQGEAHKLELAEQASKEIISYLSLRHNGIYEYESETMIQYIETANNILSSISLVGVITALVSLVVGGIAVLNVMFMSVIERTREIGIRKSIGASNSDILIQFIFESIFIAFLGGILGVFVAYVIVEFVRFAYEFEVSVSNFGVSVAIISTISVGMLSGIYPAMKASKMHPVESLRYD